MIIRDFIKENNLYLSDKGEECFISAIKDVFPSLRMSSSNTVMLYFFIDLKDEDYYKIIQLASKYAKLYIFS